MSDGDPPTDDARQVKRGRQFMRSGIVFVMVGPLWILLIPFVRHGLSVWWSMPGTALLVTGTVWIATWVSGGRR